MCNNPIQRVTTFFKQNMVFLTGSTHIDILECFISGTILVTFCQQNNKEIKRFVRLQHVCNTQSIIVYTNDDKFVNILPLF